MRHIIPGPSDRAIDRIRATRRLVSSTRPARAGRVNTPGRRKTTATILPACLSVLLLASLISCSGGGTQGNAKANGNNLGSLTYGATSPVTPPHVAAYRGALIYGKDFGLDLDKSDVKSFNDTGTALQVLLSGRIDVLSGSFLGFLQARAKQPDLRAFCPEETATTGVLVSTSNQVTTLADVGKPTTKVLVESPGGPNNFYMNLVFKDHHLNFRVEDLKNVLVVENSVQRFTTLATGNADVGVVWNYKVKDLKQQLGAKNVHVLARFAEHPAVFVAYVSTKQWLDENPQKAAAFCAAVLKANRKFTKSYDTYKHYADEYVEGDPPQAALRLTWEAASQNHVWPLDVGLTKKNVTTVVDLAMETGILKNSLSYQGIVDRRPIESAIQKLGGKASG